MERRLKYGAVDLESSLKKIESAYDTFWSSLRTPNDDWANRPRSLRGRAVTLVPSHVEEVLDLGCGSGEALKALSTRQIDLYAVDISSHALSDAKRYGEVLKADLTRLPIRERRFSCVLLLDVYEHIIDKRLLMEEVHRILSDSGTAIVTMPLPQATNGGGDPRQPYDRPLGFKETSDLISDMFAIEGLLGFPWMPIASMIETYIPLRVGFALFRAFPKLINRADSALLVLRKKKRPEIPP